LEARLGVRASPGGRHPGRGTHNALIAIGPASYIEIVAPDPTQPPSSRPRWFGIDDLTEPRLVAWAARVRDLDRAVTESAARGVPLGAVTSGSRARPDGVLLQWTLTDPNVMLAGGIVPFLIDWGDSPHPAATAAGGPSLIGFRAEHTEP